MFLFDWFHSFLPLHNPIGFGAADFLELLLAVVLVALVLFSRPVIEPFLARLAERPAWAMAVLFVLPIALRLALVAHHPAPTPNAGDEFSHLLVADTLRHFRLANPLHPFHRFFETFFVLQQPTYSSIYPLGQGISLAAGWILFGLPWAGVLLATGAFCALSYWALRGWVTLVWALLGGLFAVMEFGPLNYWMSSYWGGSFAAAAGCLVFGALPRIRDRSRPRDGVLLGIGFGLHLLTRPYESLFLAAAVILFFAPSWRTRSILRPLVAAAIVTLPALALILLQNKQVTGSWSTLPYVLSQYQYGVPVSLTFQPNPTPHNTLTPQQESEYKVQLSLKETERETPITYLTRLIYRIRAYRFFFLPPLYVALAAYVLTARNFRSTWVLITLGLFALGTNFFPAFHFHYLAAVTCLFLLVSVKGIERIARLEWRGTPLGAAAARLLCFFCAAHFIFWYGMHAAEPRNFAALMEQFESWDAINHQDPERRVAVRQQLEKLPGDQLIFVRYYPQHPSQDEWVWNRADIDASRVVWARDLGDEENRKLTSHYPGRTPWLLEPDFRPLPKLSPYPAR